MSYNPCSALEDLDNILVDCQLQKGARNYGYFIPLAYIDKSASTVSGNVVTNLVLKNNKTFKGIAQRLKGFSDTATALNAGTYANAFDNTFAFKIFGNSAEVAEQIDALKDGEYVFVIYQKHESEFNSSSAETKVSSIRIYGWDNGCTMASCDNNVWDDEMKNGWALTFTETEAPHSAMYLSFAQYTEANFPYKATFEG